ncbi:hypothetical protein VTN02DRAFT_1507 [Thermoascus thermophilus]
MAWTARTPAARRPPQKWDPHMLSKAVGARLLDTLICPGLPPSVARVNPSSGPASPGPRRLRVS